MDCIIPSCVRDASTDYCEKHKLAKDNIDDTFADWQVAYGDEYTRSDYLERLAQDYEIGSGSWVIEVAEYLLSKE